MTDETVSRISVYLNDGRVFSYECEAWKAREHVSQIIAGGYRTVRGGVLAHYPPHHIFKVTAGGQKTEYEDEVSGT